VARHQDLDWCGSLREREAGSIIIETITCCFSPSKPLGVARSLSE
jgi:hypothetical protein